MGFPGGSNGRESACNAGGLGSIPGLGRSPGGEHSNPLQYSCLENLHGQRSLVGYSPGGCKELDSTEWLSTSPQAHTHTLSASKCLQQSLASQQCYPLTSSWKTRAVFSSRCPSFPWLQCQMMGFLSQWVVFCILTLFIHGVNMYAAYTRWPTRLLEPYIQHRAANQESLVRAQVLPQGIWALRSVRDGDEHHGGAEGRTVQQRAVLCGGQGSQWIKLAFEAKSEWREEISPTKSLRERQAEPTVSAKALK